VQEVLVPTCCTNLGMAEIQEFLKSQRSSWP